MNLFSIQSLKTLKYNIVLFSFQNTRNNLPSHPEKQFTTSCDPYSLSHPNTHRPAQHQPAKTKHGWASITSNRGDDESAYICIRLRQRELFPLASSLYQFAHLGLVSDSLGFCFSRRRVGFVTREEGVDGSGTESEDRVISRWFASKWFWKIARRLPRTKDILQLSWFASYNI